MLLLATEYFPRDAVDALRARGHDVLWIRMDAPGSDDRQVLARAVTENRVVLTFDKDFGELAFHAGLPASTGVILFRMRLRSPAQVAQRVVAVLDSRSDWAGQFAVVEDQRLRMTALPVSGNGNP